MIPRTYASLACLLFVSYELQAAASDRAAASSASNLMRSVEALRPLHEKMRPPGPFDWLAQHKEEGQTFKQYLRSKPVTPRGERRIIYIQPIGDFDESEKRIVKLTADYMRRYFGLRVSIRNTIPLSSIPKRASRTHPSWGDRQILTSYVLHKVLKPRLPGDAVAMIALTTSDLWPGKDWNFVFGSASIRGRVGVWSMHRFGDPNADREGFDQCLKRTVKTAVHETGHMLSMLHCTAYECCMCGSNHLQEADSRPLYLCPECVAKLCWACRLDPVERYERLKEFTDKQGWEPESEFFERSIERIKGSARRMKE